MASKPVKAIAKLMLPAGGANPAPPVGTALGPHGINLMEFCKQFNAATQEMKGDTIPAVITIYEDRSFSIVLKTPPASALLKKAAGIEKGAGNPLTQKVGKVTKADIKAIVEKKKNDLNANSEAAAFRIIEGTAKNMGIEVEK